MTNSIKLHIYIYCPPINPDEKQPTPWETSIYRTPPSQDLQIEKKKNTLSITVIDWTM